jgi:rRNA maturation RNase YbeY
MITVYVTKQSNYPVNASKIKKTIQDTLQERGVVSDFSVDVAIVGDAKMDELAKEYYMDDPEGEYDHPILTFPSSEAKENFITPEGEIPSLGEMVISYPSVVARAKEANKLIDDIVCELAAHGSIHLAGIHHEH